MTRDLVTGEGVDDASASSTAEGTGGSASPAASPGPRTAGLPAQAATVEGGGDDVLGEPPHGAPASEEEAAPPVDVETEESRRARAERGTGQQYQTGEG